MLLSSPGKLLSLPSPWESLIDGTCVPWGEISPAGKDTSDIVLPYNSFNCSTYVMPLKVIVTFENDIQCSEAKVRLWSKLKVITGIYKVQPFSCTGTFCRFCMFKDETQPAIDLHRVLWRVLLTTTRNVFTNAPVRKGTLNAALCFSIKMNL